MNGLTDAGVLFEDEDRAAGFRQRSRGAQATRAGTNHDHVYRVAAHRSAGSHQNLRSRSSHVPRRLIQNESSINRRSSQKERRLT